MVRSFILPHGDRQRMSETNFDRDLRLEMLDRWTFPWPVMDVLIAGKSSIDLPRLHVNSAYDALEFMRSYGFDPLSTRDQRRIHAIKVEAMSFIERVLIPDEWEAGTRPPEDVLRSADICQLLLWASVGDREGDIDRRAWACSILRVMHTIAHLEDVYGMSNLRLAHQQIAARFQRHIVHDQQGRIWLGESNTGVELSSVSWKLHKTRDSMLLKLLHKPANVSETIYDVLGVRIVTKRLCDVMMVVRMLRSLNMVTFPNCNPTRARNTLLDNEAFRINLEMLTEMLRAGKLSAAEFDQLIAQMTVPGLPPSKSGKANPHSSVSYRALQLTCRQMVRIPDPRATWLRKMSEAAAICPENSPERQAFTSMHELVSQWGGRNSDELAYFFPFEVQIMDEAAYQENSQGDASHDRYKVAQIRTARRRVMREILKL